MGSTPLPPFAPFPTATWKELLSIDEWNASLGAWISLAEAHLSLPDADFSRETLKDDSILQFLTSFMRELASHGSALLGTSNSAKLLLKACFFLVAKIMKASSPQDPLLQWEFLSDFSRVYSKRRVGNVLSHLSNSSQELMEASLAALKKYLIKNLDDGLKGDLKAVEERLGRLNHLINASPSTASFFLAGSEFLDGLITCYRIMNPPLRKVIITTAYLILIGLTECEPPKLSMLTDQLYSLKTAAEAHKVGPLNVNDSMVAELVSTTPLLQQIEHKLDSSGTENARAKNGLRDLATFKKPGAGMKPRRLIRRKIDKGKGIALDDHEAMSGEVHIHRMSQISQVQDLFPELGSGFVAKLLDEYGDDSEQVIAHLLDDSLPSHLKGADRGEQLSTNTKPRRRSSLIPRSTPPLIPTRRNVFDDDELDRLAVDTSRLHIGKKAPERTADDILADRSTAPKKAAILSALAAFDSDDDERDDTYDAADVGGTVDATNTEENANDNEETLWKAYQADAKTFDRDQATRRGAARSKLKLETGMTDETIEGWAVMLSRNANQKRRLEMKYSAANAFTGQQNDLASTSWRANAAGSGTEVSDTDGGSGRGGRGGRGRGGGGRGRGGGRGGGNVAGPSGEHDTEQARRRKEASKGQRANHNRRDQRAKKMARGGFPG
ncbi:Activating signal cointegrator 1 complex subunit 2 [Cytospora mali]|uniref:Activating signal cointegrator 1 complex subunit 2 n=1 Tax=Cytospora mali TaxID=578113 RepID=A0A194VR65_CYTMA|nr:Activating signal cointegrator 1 complex subunit 2 [Valsa mali]